MVIVTPGVDYLAKGLVFFVGYGIFTSTSVSYLAARTGYDIPRWMVLAACIASVPLISATYVIGQKISRWRRSYTVGARIVPEVQGSYPGNLDVLHIQIKNLEVGYPGMFKQCICRLSCRVTPSGDGLDELLNKYGPVINLRVMWSDLILTTSPEHIKTILASDFQNYVKGNAAFMALPGSRVFRCLLASQDRDSTITWKQCWGLESLIQTVRP